MRLSWLDHALDSHSNPAECVGPSLPGSFFVGRETQTVLLDHCKKDSKKLVSVQGCVLALLPGSTLLSSAGELENKAKNTLLCKNIVLFPGLPCIIRNTNRRVEKGEGLLYLVRR